MTMVWPAGFDEQAPSSPQVDAVEKMLTKLVGHPIAAGRCYHLTADLIRDLKRATESESESRKVTGHARQKRR